MKEKKESPHNIEAEKAIIGAVLMAPDCFNSIRETLDADDFYDRKHGLIFSALLDIADIGAPIDTITLRDTLDRKNSFQAAGGHSYVSEILESTATAVNIDHYCRIVKEKSLLRKTADQAKKIIDKTLEPGTSIDDIPSLSIEKPQPIIINHVSDINRTLNRNIERGYPGIHPGYDIFERTIRKISPGHLWVIGGYTSTGKSFLVCDMITRLYRTLSIINPGIALFSVEMSCEQYLLRLLANFSRIPDWVIKEKKYTDLQATAITHAMAHFDKCNLYIYDNLYKITDIERTTKMLKDRKGLDIIIIDYLQNLWGKGDIYERMSALAPSLQYLAKELQITIIALSQVNNESVKNKTPLLGYKGAGEIAASADLGIEIERDKVNKDRMIVDVKKNRHGRTDKGILEFVDGYTKLYEVLGEE